MLGLGAIGAVALTFLLPSQILKPEAVLSLDLVKETYEPMILDALKGLPQEKVAYIQREECWAAGKTICVYGWWYEERKKHAYLVSYTLADEEEAKRGILHGWWCVDYGKKLVRPAG